MPPGGDGTMSAAFAILGGNVAVIGDLTSVKAAIDTKGTNSLATDPDFEAASATATKDYIGFAYVDMQAVVASALDASKAVGTDLPAVSTTLTDPPSGLDRVPAARRVRRARWASRPTPMSIAASGRRRTA